MLPTKFQFIWLKWVSEEKIKMWKVKTTDAKWWQKLTLPLVRWAKTKINFQGYYDFLVCVHTTKQHNIQESTYIITERKKLNTC